MNTINLQEVRDAIQEKSQEVTQQVTESAEQIAQNASELVEEIAHPLQQSHDYLSKRTLQEIATDIKAFVHKNPGTSLGIGFTAGVILGAMLPSRKN